MAAITIRRLDDALKQSLRVQAAKNGRSMEEEAREILRSSLNRPAPPLLNLGERIRRHILPLGGVELELPLREPVPEPPVFE